MKTDTMLHKKYLTRLLLIVVIALIPIISEAQDASQIVTRVSARINKVKDYSAQANIRPDIPLINIQPVQATMYFKQKDKFRIVSKSIAILPKQGFSDVTRLLLAKENFTSVLSGSELVAGTKTSIITLLPTNDTADVILAKIWVDTQSDLIMKAQVTTRSSGTLSMIYTYGAQREFALPQTIVFTMDVKKFKIPKGVATDINRSSTKDETKPPTTSGTITVNISDYKINKGLSDEVFRD